jgi:diguanylate cyclase (GGDEF)-like protein
MRVTASLGVAVAGPSIDDVYTLLRRADEALYLAKRRGRNRIELADAAKSGLSLAGER